MSTERNKGAVALSGIDPGMKRLNRLHAIRSNQQKKLDNALASIEHYWEEVQAAIDAQLQDSA